MNEFKNMPYTFYLDNYKKRQWLVRVWKKGKSDNEKKELHEPN